MVKKRSAKGEKKEATTTCEQQTADAASVQHAQVDGAATGRIDEGVESL